MWGSEKTMNNKTNKILPSTPVQTTDHDAGGPNCPPTPAAPWPEVPSAAMTPTPDLAAAIRTAATSNDPFDLSRLRVVQDSGVAAGVKKHVATIPVRKPDKFTWVRVHPDRAFHLLDAAVIQNKEENEVFLVDAALHDALASFIVTMALFPIMTRQGVLMLWPVRVPDLSGRIDTWNESALEASTLATTEWVKLVANRSLGAYEIYTAPGDLGEPAWPELSLTDMLRIAFKGKVITSMDHLMVRRLRGEV